MSQAEAHRLAKEKATIEAKNEKFKEEAVRLRQELQDIWVGFFAQKEDLEADYQKQVNNMFFYGYQCCMKKHDIANHIPRFPSNDDEDKFLGGPAQGDRHVSRDNSSGKRA